MALAAPRPEGPPEREKAERFMQFIRAVSPTADPVSVILFSQMLRAHNQLLNAVEKNLAAVGLSWGKFRLLMNLGRCESYEGCEGMQPSELSELQGISRNTASALISALEKQGLVARSLHNTDRRRFVIRLTPKGRHVLRANLDSQFRFVSHCFDEFTKEERIGLIDHLARLNQSLITKAKSQACAKPARRPVQAASQPSRFEKSEMSEKKWKQKA
jgi:DNA-binding MarR family transcriptional regulator